MIHTNQKLRSASRLLIALLVEFSWASTLLAQDTPIVRVSKPLVIDGSAEDWPIPATVLLASSDGSAKMRFAADASAFYAFVEVDDESPLKNRAGSAEEMIGGGDAVAFYFRTTANDAQRVALTRRNGQSEIYVYRTSSEAKRPYAFRSPTGEALFEYVAPIEATVSVSERRGKGYAAEVAIPWESLGYVGAPARFGFDAQVLFSDPGGTQTMGTAWLFAQEGPAHTIEDLPTMARLYPDTWGQAELADELRVPLSSQNTHPVNLNDMTMIEVDLPRPGRLSLNLVADDGWILRELVRAESFAAGHHRIAWDGRDRYGEPLSPGDYHWKALLFDGMRTEFMGSVGNSGRPPYRTPDGLGSMGGQHGVQKSVAVDAGGVYLANALQEGPPVMRKVDPATARALWTRSAGSFRSVDAVAAAEGMACFINGMGRKLDYAADLVRIDPETGQDIEMAIGSARLTLAEAQGQNQVAGLAIVDGKAWIALPAKNQIIGIDLGSGQPVPALTVAAPQGLARQDATTLLVCSGATVSAIDVRTGAVTMRLNGLDEPRAVAVDAGGALYVSELGSHQQISKYQGVERVATWGKLGGKSNQQIPYEPMAFRGITGIAVDAAGKIWLAEADGLVRRYVTLDAEGSWLEDIYGPVAYNAFGPDLDDFRTVYYTIAGGCFNEVAIDYDQYRRDPLQPAKAWHIRAIHDLGLAADGIAVNELMRDVAKTGYGHVIAFRADNGHRYFFRLSKHNRAKIPPGAGIWIEKDGRWVPCAFISKDDKKHPSWADANGDGLIQPEEAYTGLPVDEASWLDRDLTLHGYKGKLSPAAYTKAGAPVYAGGAFSPYLSEGKPSHTGNQWTFFSPGYGDTVYYISNHGPHRHLSFWDRASENRLIKISNGKVQWIAGQHAAHPNPTEFSTNSGIAGMVDGVVLVQNIEPASYIAYTEDGFVLGDIMLDESGKHPKVGPTVINIESFTGLYLKEPGTGRNVLFAVSSGDDRILEVKGPGQTTHLKGSVALSHVASLGNTITIPYSSWWGNTTRGIGVDGMDTEWQPKVKAVTLEADGKAVADVRLRRDAGNLYLFASVLEREPTAGDGITLVLTNDPDSLSPKTITIDLILKASHDRWQIEPAFLRDGQPDSLAKVNTAITERWCGLGYRIEAEIPMGLLLDFAEPREQQFRRPSKKNRDMTTITAELPDLKSPLFMKLQVHRAGQQPGTLSPVDQFLHTNLP